MGADIQIISETYYNLKKKIVDNMPVFLVLLSTVFIIYLPSLYYDFFFIDDSNNVLDSRFIKAPAVYAFVGAWLESTSLLTFNTWQFVSKIIGIEHASTFRSLNVLIHCLNGMMVFTLCNKILSRKFQDGNVLLSSICGAMFFIVHPLQVESIIWISNLRSVLSGSFGLLFLLTYLYPDTDRNSTIFNSKALAFVYFMSAIFLKPTAVFIFIWAGILDLIVNKKNYKDVVKDISLYPLVIIAAFLGKESIFLNQQILDLTLVEKLSVTVNSLLINVKNLILPFDLHILYPHSLYSSKSMFGPLQIFIGLWLLVASFLILLKFNKMIFAVLIGYFIMISINLGILSYQFQSLSIISDSFSYLPLIACSILFSLLALSFSKFKIPIYAILLLLVVTSMNRVALWQQDSLVLENDKEILQNKNVGQLSQLNYKTLLAKSYIKDRRFDEAFNIFQQMINVDNPTFEEITNFFNTLRLYGSMEGYVSVLPLIQLIEKSTMMSYYSLELARYFEFIGDYESSKKYYQITEKIYPSFKVKKFDNDKSHGRLIGISLNRVARYLIRKGDTPFAIELLNSFSDEDKLKYSD
jgi:pentatricopeptide repeat protein